MINPPDYATKSRLKKNQNNFPYLYPKNITTNGMEVSIFIIFYVSQTLKVNR